MNGDERVLMVIHCRASHTGDAARVMYSSVSVGVVLCSALTVSHSQNPVVSEATAPAPGISVALLSNSPKTLPDTSHHILKGN